MDTMHGDWGAEMGFGMWVFWIVLIVVIVVIFRVVFGSRSNVTPSASAEAHDTTLVDSHEDAQEILKARYARGEIDDEEFERRKSELEK